LVWPFDVLSDQLKLIISKTVRDSQMFKMKNEYKGEVVFSAFDAYIINIMFLRKPANISD